MRERGQQATSNSVRERFERAPAEPLTTTEVAAEFEFSRRTAYNKLEALVEQGVLKTKKVGASGRIWWRPDASEVELTSDQMQMLRYRSVALAQPFTAIGADAVRFETESSIPLPDGTSLHHAVVAGISPDTYLELVESYPQVEAVQILGVTDESFRVQARVAEDVVAGTFEAFGGRLERTVLESDAFLIEGVVEATASPVQVTEALQRAYSDVELLERQLVYTPRLFRGVVEETVTERQMTALQSAYYAGYFEDPRTCTGAELGDALGVSKQTFHHHLRRAERAVFSQLFEASHDADM